MNIRNLDPRVQKRLKERAVRHGISMEEEVRRILTQAVTVDEPADLAALFLSTFGRRHGIELELPGRSELPREPEL